MCVCARALLFLSSIYLLATVLTRDNDLLSEVSVEFGNSISSRRVMPWVKFCHCGHFRFNCFFDTAETEWGGAESGHGGRTFKRLVKRKQNMEIRLVAIIPSLSTHLPLIHSSIAALSDSSVFRGTCGCKWITTVSIVSDVPHLVLLCCFFQLIIY